MRKTFLLLVAALGMMAFIPSPASLTKEERKFAINDLKETRKGVLQTMRNLSEAQLKYKPAPDKWSIEECMKHIAVSEATIYRNIQTLLAAPANPEKRPEVKMADSMILKMIGTRNFKAQAPEIFKPENAPYSSAADALTSFEQSRETLIDFVKKTEDDLRNHITQTPLGWMDAYQMILLISAHANRHTQQMKEVMANPEFPKY